MTLHDQGPSHPSEVRRATHDGYIWPVDRADMRDPNHIRARMAQDIRAIDRYRHADEGYFGYLRSAGWTPEQIAEHSRAAHDGAATPLAEAAHAALTLAGLGAFLWCLWQVAGMAEAAAVARAMV